MYQEFYTRCSFKSRPKPAKQITSYLTCGWRSERFCPGLSASQGSGAGAQCRGGYPRKRSHPPGYSQRRAYPLVPESPVLPGCPRGPGWEECDPMSRLHLHGQAAAGNDACWTPSLPSFSSSLSSSSMQAFLCFLRPVLSSFLCPTSV